MDYTKYNYKVLNDGFVRLVDSMPSSYKEESLKFDESIVRSARVSYGQSSKGPERDAKLVKYLVEHEHGTPLEAVVFQFHIKCPIFVQRHIVKHRMTTMNEISARYTTVEDSWYIPDNFRTQSKSNRQASGEDIKSDKNEELIRLYNKACENAYNHYNILLSQGVSREMARVLLPQSMYTQFYWKIDLRNLLHFCRLRNSEDAQYETRVYAQAIENIVKELCPISYKAFKK